ncbi:MAG: hypothetical protein ACKKL4_02280 [Patescibacteria group bacterium]
MFVEEHTPSVEEIAMLFIKLRRELEGYCAFRESKGLWDFLSNKKKQARLPKEIQDKVRMVIGTLAQKGWFESPAVQNNLSLQKKIHSSLQNLGVNPPRGLASPT